MASREQAYSEFKLPPENPALPPRPGGPMIPRKAGDSLPPTPVGRPPIGLPPGGPPPVVGRPPAAIPLQRAAQPPQPIYDAADLDINTFSNSHQYNLGVNSLPKYHMATSRPQPTDLYIQPGEATDQYFEPAVVSTGYPQSFDLRGQAAPSRVLIPPKKAGNVAVKAVMEDTYLDLEGVGSEGPLQRQPSTRNTATLSGKDPLAGHAWYYPDITRQDAEEMLRNEPLGSFVVRPGKRPGLFVLSVKIEDGSPPEYSHMEIAPKYSQSSSGGTRTVFILGGFSEPHSSVQSLIEYHHHTPIEIIGKVNICLQDPVPY